MRKDRDPQLCARGGWGGSLSYGMGWRHIEIGGEAYLLWFYGGRGTYSSR